MALIRCRECGKKISEFCGVCPNCGCPVEAVNEAVNPPDAEIDSTIDQPNAETDALEKKPELTYIQKRNQRIIRIISAAILVVIGLALFTYANDHKYDFEKSVYSNWYLDALEDDTVADTMLEYLERFDNPNRTFSSMQEFANSFERYMKEEKLSGQVAMKQLPYYLGGVGCFALAGYVLFTIRKYPLIKRDHAETPQDKS